MQPDRARQACAEFCRSIAARPCFDAYGDRWTGDGATCAAARLPGASCRSAAAEALPLLTDALESRHDGQ